MMTLETVAVETPATSATVADGPLREMVFGTVLGGRKFGEDHEVSGLNRARPRPDVASICDVVSRAYEVAGGVLMTKAQKKNEGRDVARYLAREHSGLKLAELGEQFGGISADAVCHARRRVAGRMRRSRTFRKRIVALERELGKKRETGAEEVLEADQG